MEKYNPDETIKPEILVKAATVDDEIRRVKHVVSFF